jgi:hypothetical protein
MASLSHDLSDEDRKTLQLYRRAAGRVHTRLGPYAGHEFRVQLFRQNLPDEGNLIPEAEFLALLTAVRVTYAQGERTSFRRVANILAQVGDDEVRRFVVEMRRDFENVLNRRFQFLVHGTSLNPKGLLDTFINGEVFHQDETLLAVVDELRDLGALSEMVLQQTVRDLCFPILGLDNLCAMALDEPLRPPPLLE